MIDDPPTPAPRSPTRLFLALLPDVTTLGKLSNLQSGLRTALAADLGLHSQLRWIAASQIHLTMVFIGNTGADLTTFLSTVRDVTARYPPLPISFNGLSCFPAIRPPQVIWLDCMATDIFGELQEALSFTVRHCFPDLQGDFSPPHMTLARISRQPKLPVTAADLSRHLAGLWQQQNLLPAQWAARSVELLSSKLTPRGARYSSIASFPLSQKK